MIKLESFFVPSISNEPLFVDQILEGGFGYVFVVKDVKGIKYALKTLKWELGLEKELFYKELNKQLEIPPHKNVIQLFDVIEQNGMPFICMSYSESNLRQQMQTITFTPKQIEKIIIDLATGLNHIHTTVNILHLDLKPENILIGIEGNCLLSDFGSSRVYPRPNLNSIQSKLFLSGLSGTIAYMSPEHFTSHEVSVKSDVFALGIILYELLTGNHPFTSRNFKTTVQNILYKQINFSIVESLRFPRHLRKLCLAALNKNPLNRPSSKEILEFLIAYKGDFKKSEKFDYEATINHAGALTATGRYKESEYLLKKCIENNPFKYLAYLNLAVVYFEQGKHQEAVDMSENLIELTEWDSSKRESLETLYVNLSHYYMVLDPMKSISLAKKALQINDRDWQALGNLAESCRIFGEANQNAQFLSDALSACKRALAINPKDLKLRVTYVAILLALDKLDELFPLLDSLIKEAGTSDYNTRFLWVRVLIRTGELELAIKILQPMRKSERLQKYIKELDKQIEQRQKQIGVS